jgi:hypothetical protein
MKYLFSIFTIVSFHLAISQDDLLDLLDSNSNDKTEIVSGTFKGTRLINGHSIETRKKNSLEFIIAHRFGVINSGGYNLWGLDNASIRIGLEYAPTDRLFVGMGRSSYLKTYDGLIKYRLLQQSKGAKSIPVSITLLSTIALKTDTLANPELNLIDKSATTHQALIARKFSPDFSLQLMPTFIHFNTITATQLNNNLFALGIGGRYKFTSRVALSIEYFHQLIALESNGYNAIAIGVDIETGGHIFQLQFTNATSMIEKGFIAENTLNNFFAGDIHFGFNINRTFQLGK